MNTLVFDMDDTLLVEEASAEAAFRAVCRFAEKKTGVDAEGLRKSIRESCRTIWYDSQAHPFCLKVGISSWEGLWAEFKGDDKNLCFLADWAPTYRRESWREAVRLCGHKADDLFATELADMFVEERRKLHIVYDDVVPVLNDENCDTSSVYACLPELGFDVYLWKLKLSTS
jgi:putative hydrolase of the HAD superfamily